MTKPGDSQTKKTIHELVKEFPDKSYRELEIYRDADRQKEAASIPLTESQKSQDKLEPIGIGHNHPPGETFKISFKKTLHRSRSTHWNASRVEKERKRKRKKWQRQTKLSLLVLPALATVIAKLQRMLPQI